jgi:3D (Asp-Asp-Asp) domain-containing protein
MIRKFYWICILVLSMGSPLLAKNSSQDTVVKALLPSKSGKGTIAVPDSSPAPAADAKAAVAKKEQAQKKPVVVITPDTSRGAVSPALAAKQQAAQQATLPTPAPIAHASSLVIRNSTIVNAGSIPVRTSSGSALMVSAGYDRGESGDRLARVTAYWAGEGDYYTGRCMSATGVRLHDGHCAVDPNIIPYGSVVSISGVGRFLAVDTGSAVISRTAAREGGHTAAERHAIVVDLFFEDADAGQRFAAGAAKYVSISWYTPTAMNDEAKDARSEFADENWVKIQSKQL